MNNPSPRTILMSADTLGGVWTYALELIEGLQSFDIQVHLATMGRPLSPEQCRVVETFSNVTIQESNYKLEWMDDPWEDLQKAGAWLQHLANVIKPDLIHFNHYAHADLPWEVPTVVVAHSCVYTWWKAVYKASPPPYWYAYYQLVKKNLEAADAVVAVSEAFLKQLYKIYGNHYSANVIYNGISFTLKQHKTKENIIFGMGRIWDEAKNLVILESVAPQIPWQIQIAGDAFHPVLQQEKPLQGLQTLGLLNRAAILQKLAQSRIFIAPAMYEPFGLAPLEAAAHGCALALSDLPTFRELWGDAAFYFPANDAETLTGIIKELIANKELLNDFAQKAYNRSQLYTSRIMTQRYVNLYKNIMQQKKHSSTTKAKAFL